MGKKVNIEYTSRMPSIGLPIESSLPELKAALEKNSNVILQAPPGSGKSTLVPLALLGEQWLAGKKILLLQPRRVAARSLAQRMAELAGDDVGNTVGYRIRFESKISRATRIELITEGILTRMIQDDSALENVGLVIFDEFHERSIHADLALAFALDVQASIRPDLKLLIMSATIETARLSDFLGGAPVVTGSGIPFPVETKYLPQDPAERIYLTAARETLRAEREDEGDILVFLPGVEEIRRTKEGLEQTNCTIFELYGDQTGDAQRRALMPDKSGKRKIILSTPIAETSLTIEGVRVVVDSGLVKRATFDAGYGLNRLRTERISRDSSEQRAGRAGRLGPGVCRRLWSEHTQRSLRPARVPEILESDLSAFILETAAWGAKGPGDLRFLDQPKGEDWEQAAALLKDLGALDEAGGLTPLGRELVSIPAHPRIGAMFAVARASGFLPLACDLAALLDERDIFRRDFDGGASLDLRLHALRSFRRGKSGGAEKNQCARVDRAAKDWARRFSAELGSEDVPEGEAGLLLSFAYPERVAIRREAGSGRYLLAGGLGAQLGEHDPLKKNEFLVIAHLHAGAGDNRVFLAAAVSREEIREAHADQISSESRVFWDSETESVRGETVEAFGKVVFARERTAPFRELSELLLCEELRKRGGVEALGWDADARQLQERITWARNVFPEENFPEASTEALNEQLEAIVLPLLPEGRSIAEVRALSARGILDNMLSFKQKQFLQAELPQQLEGPDGKKRSIDYENAESPVLSATVQELFGWKETPRIARGRIPLTIHILSPARRPIQVTRDLKGFWEKTYVDVRKELRGRYPKHQWPEDPADAVPGGRRRKKES